MGIPLLRGRLFTNDDRAGKQLVLIVNQKLAQHYWPGQDPIGKRIRIGTAEMQTPWMTVVGVVADVKLAFTRRPSEGAVLCSVARRRKTSGRSRILQPI